jgi:hypothetical protein
LDVHLAPETLKVRLKKQGNTVWNEAVLNLLSTQSSEVEKIKLMDRKAIGNKMTRLRKRKKTIDDHFQKNEGDLARVQKMAKIQAEEREGRAQNQSGGLVLGIGDARVSEMKVSTDRRPDLPPEESEEVQTGPGSTYGQDVATTGPGFTYGQDVATVVSNIYNASKEEEKDQEEEEEAQEEEEESYEGDDQDDRDIYLDEYIDHDESDYVSDEEEKKMVQSMREPTKSVEWLFQTGCVSVGVVCSLVSWNKSEFTFVAKVDPHDQHMHGSARNGSDARPEESAPDSYSGIRSHMHHNFMESREDSQSLTGSFRYDSQAAAVSDCYNTCTKVYACLQCCTHARFKDVIEMSRCPDVKSSDLFQFQDKNKSHCKICSYLHTIGLSQFNLENEIVHVNNTIHERELFSIES